MFSLDVVNLDGFLMLFSLQFETLEIHCNLFDFVELHSKMFNININ